jgi:hypothetical protein
VLPRRPFDFLFLGFIHLELQMVVDNSALRTADELGVLDRLDWYLRSLTNLGLSITLTAAWGLQNIRDRLDALPPGSTLEPADAELIRSSALMLRETLKAETTNLVLYQVSGKRFDTRALLQDVPSLMRAGTYQQLPYIAVADLHEAATCIAFERPTAAAFHALRATEKVLRHYYSCVVVRNRMSEPWLWGRIVIELQRPRRARRPDPALVEHLDSIRLRFRNPTQHPEKIYDIEEAQNLFGQCVSVIESMVADTPWVEPADSINSVIAGLQAERAEALPPESGAAE